MEEVEIEVTVQPGLHVRVLQSASADAVLERAVHDARIDPYAHIVWPSSVAAARTLARLVVPGMQVLDVGAGTGLCALTASVMGTHAIALDRDAPSLDRIMRAASLNGVAVQALRLDIGTATPLPDCDVAVFADLLYEESLAAAVAERVAEVRQRGSISIVADPGRAGRATFDECARQRGIAVAYEDVSVQLPGDTPAIVQVAVIN